MSSAPTEVSVEHTSSKLPPAAARASAMRAAMDPEGDDAPMTMRAMLEAGVHFGHQTNRWNPKMRPYIYGARNGIHIIDLQQTLPMFIRAYNMVLDVVSNGREVLFVGTKKQAQDVVAEEATRCGMFYVTNRWLGGTLTNWRTVRSSIEKLREIEQRVQESGSEGFTKKEILRMSRLRDKLERNLGGIKSMSGLPGAMFVVDPRKERIALAEARKLEIPIIAVTDTNCDPDSVDYVIPGNDDAIRAVRLFAAGIADACILGKRLGRERAAATGIGPEKSEDLPPQQIHVHSGGDGPKVEVVSRRSPARPEPEAVAGPENNDK
jgi:small subunit ribosomal protein S2